jgi:hypothetical protein
MEPLISFRIFWPNTILNFTICTSLLLQVLYFFFLLDWGGGRPIVVWYLGCFITFFHPHFYVVSILRAVVNGEFVRMRMVVSYSKIFFQYSYRNTDEIREKSQTSLYPGQDSIPGPFGMRDWNASTEPDVPFVTITILTWIRYWKSMSLFCSH